MFYYFYEITHSKPLKFINKTKPAEQGIALFLHDSATISQTFLLHLMSHANCVPKTMSFTDQGSIITAIKSYMHPSAGGKKKPTGVTFVKGQTEERGRRHSHPFL